MVQGWATTVVLAFGIGVAVIGVIAYLRMFRKDRLSSTSYQASDISPPNDVITVKSTDNGHDNEVKTEQAASQD